MTSLLQDTKGVLAGDALRQGNSFEFAWSGQTVDSIAKEIFLDGGATFNNRLVIPTNTLTIAEGLFSAWNETDSTVHASGRFALSVTNIAGTTAASGTTLEWDADSADANPFSQYFVGSSAAGLVFTYNNTSKAIIATVTGAASKTIRWYAELTSYIAQAL